jgi:acetyl esterase/lipase
MTRFQRRRYVKVLQVGASIALLFGGVAGRAQAPNDAMVAIATPAQPRAINLATGTLPNAPAPEGWHRQYEKVFVRNVSVATLTPFLPDPKKATGAAVLVAPGGGFQSLSMENEGWDVARALAARGIAAFVLKYRLNQTPGTLTEFEQMMRTPRSGPRAPMSELMANLAPQVADARAAFALIRRNASRWRVDPDRVGMVGFSAGAMLTLATTMSTSDSKPAFIGNIYGPISPMNVPADAPPMFVALAADDPLFGNSGFALIENWKAAKRPVEFHLYERGGHGFGMYAKTTTSTGWFDAFVRWLAMHEMLTPKR